MKTVEFGNVKIGVIPRVVGTVSSLDALSALSSAEAVPCDIVEARLDKIGHQSTEVWLNACRRIEAGGTPVIVTLRDASEGGNWKQGDEGRPKIFEEALKHLSAVDVEFKSGIVESVYNVAKDLEKALIVSYHDFVRTPPEAELLSVVSAASRFASVVKISAIVRDSSDIATLKALLESSGDVPLCVMGMGSVGTHTRAVFPTLGSCLTYGYLDTPSAPGQLPAEKLIEYLRENLAAYNEDYITRKQSSLRTA